ncbi:MAG TPA: STN domain-containing protein, partial [Verrucomicrobiae bacterium]|nr:STN domain-containing protein [Verrucomicrobiae bacterium]
ILISVTVLSVAGLAWAGRAIYRAKKNIVTIDVYNAPLADVIRQLERQTRETILARSDIQTKVTLNVKNVPLDEALDKLGQQAGVNWSKWHAVHDSSRALDKLETALRNRGKLEEVGWTNLAPQEVASGPIWDGGTGVPVPAGGTTVTREITGAATGMTVGGRKPVMIKLDSGNIKNGDVQATIREKMKAAGMDDATIAKATAAMKEQQVDVDVQARPGAQGPGISDVMFKSSDAPPRIRMVTRSRDGSGKMFEEIWSPEHLVLEQKLLSKLGNESQSDPSENAAREVAKKVKGDLTTLYVLSGGPGGIAFGGRIMRQLHAGGGADGTNGVPGQLPPVPDLEAVVRRHEAENYVRLTPEQRVQRAREKQAAKANR